MRTLNTCDLAVVSESPSVPAISALPAPVVTCSTTSRSRAVKPSSHPVPEPHAPGEDVIVGTGPEAAEEKRLVVGDRRHEHAHGAFSGRGEVADHRESVLGRRGQSDHDDVGGEPFGVRSGTAQVSGLAGDLDPLRRPEGRTQPRSHHVLLTDDEYTGIQRPRPFTRDLGKGGLPGIMSQAGIHSCRPQTTLILSKSSMPTRGTEKQRDRPAIHPESRPGHRQKGRMR